METRHWFFIKSLRKDKSGSSQHGIPASLKSSEYGRSYFLPFNKFRKKITLSTSEILNRL